ncbi:hypothetical protein AB1Y20_013078 [Prymnesium parvum]|uniref:Methyltransferase domain-containing protein n=1 Tax=Prymnesium parvum TaxID=97485 RepID=A0AB34IM41_PRYPA
MIALAGPTAAAPASSTLSMQRTEAFSQVYSHGHWLNGADGALCRSGWSAVHAGQAAAALAAVGSVLRENNLSAMIDVPVGDGCFAEAALPLLRQSVNLTYQGLDIVPELIESNRKRFGDARTRFTQADVTTLASLPQFASRSLLFSRMMMQHMCNQDVRSVLKLISASNASFALLTTFKTEESFVNTDIGCASSGYRAQDLTKPPFSLPAPREWFDERYPEDHRVGLGLWKLPISLP